MEITPTEKDLSDSSNSNVGSYVREIVPVSGESDITINGNGNDVLC